MTDISRNVLKVGERSPTSIYVYDLQRLRHRCRLVAEMAVGPKRVFFATMANDNPDILACVRDAGLGVFVNSRLHLDLVLGLGFSSEQVVYAASNMLPDEIAYCLGQGIHLVLDSLGQLTTLCEILGRQGLRRILSLPISIGVRLNVGSIVDGIDLRPDPGYRFGLLKEELPAALHLTNRHGVRIVGAHAYFGTDVMQPTILLRGLDRLGRAAVDLPDLCYLDVAGGLGVPDDLMQPQFDLSAYARGAARIMRRHSRKLQRLLEFYIEPGRYLVADAGYYFVKVVDVKVRGDRVFVGTNGSVADFPRPLLYPDRARHPCEVIGVADQNEVSSLPVYVCGNTTYSQDFLAREVSIPLPRPGDTLVFHHAGAYGRSMVTRFLGREPPTERCLGSRDDAISATLPK